MSKINLKARLVSDDEKLDIEVIGIKSKNKIVYKENDITVTILLLNNKIKMNRVCSEYKINLIFEKDKSTISTYNVFDISKKFDLETKTQKLIITDDRIEINYELEQNKFYYLLELGG